MRDIVNNLGTVPALVPAVHSATANGLSVDLAGFNSVMFVVNTGAIAGSGDFSVKVQESDASGSGFADAPEAGVIGSTIPASLTADGVFKIGYLGHKQHVRLVLTKAGGTSIAAGALAILGHPQNAPVA